jgi:2-C-methyl-D-erythritol 4-phosphate cytidylyltransferase
MDNYVIIVAGGSGTRMKSPVPKQFLELAGKPVLMHTILKFVTFDPSIRIILVLPEEHHATWLELCAKYRFGLKYSIVNGGETRFHSVKNGLNIIKGDGIVAVHDGVRPLVSDETIVRCFKKAEECGNAVPCVPVYETARLIEGNYSRLIDRSALRLIQTPQVFNVKIIQQAYLQTYRPYFTDDAAVIESTGEIIHLVEGNRENIKITEPLDLAYAQYLLKENPESKNSECQ